MKKWWVRIFLVLIGLPLALLLFGAAAFGIVNRSNGSLTSSGEERHYSVVCAGKL